MLVEKDKEIEKESASNNNSNRETETRKLNKNEDENEVILDSNTPTIKNNPSPRNVNRNSQEKILQIKKDSMKKMNKIGSK